MKRNFATVTLLLLASCATLSPIQDPKESPAHAHIYNMEIEACGMRDVRTSACVFQEGVAPSGQISIRAPFTNTKGKAAKLELLSPECGYSSVQLVAPGQVASYSVASIIGTSKFCSVQAILSPVWDNQDTFVFPTEPLMGRVLLMVLDHPLTSVSGRLGFTSVEKILGSEVSPVVSLDTQGSEFGQVLYAGCGAMMSVPYTQANPGFILPFSVQSCVLFGTIQMVDKPGSLSFALAVNVLPISYEKLADPILDANMGESDPAVSAVDFGSFVLPGGQFKLSKKHLKFLGPEYDIRQITTAGRYSLSHVVNGKIVWSMK